MSTTDHTEFIVKHHQDMSQRGGHENKRSRWLMLFFLFFVAMAYLAVCITIAYALELNVAVIAIIVFVFVGTFAGSFGVQHIKQLFSKQEKERKLLLDIMEGSRSAQLVTDHDKGVVYANHKFRLLCGKKEPSLNTLASVLGNEEDIARHFHDLARQAAKGAVSSLEFNATKNGKIAWYRVISQPVVGRRDFVHWRVDDITMNHEAERAVQEEREKLIDFTDNAPVGFFSVDEDGRFVFVNATLARWLGQDIDQLLASGTLHNCLLEPPEDDAPYDVVVGGGARQVAEVKMKGRGGRVFLASVNQAVVHEGVGIIRTRGVVHDLTDERAMRMALKASEDRFQRFFEEAPIGIVILDPKGMVGDCNSELAVLLGVEVQSLEKTSFRSWVSEDDREMVFAEFDRILKGELMSAPMEIVLNGKDKKEVPVRTYARKFKDSDNLLVHFIDLTTQKVLEQQFTQSQKMQAVGQLAGGVAHDFNNLLTAIIGYCDLLLLRHKPGDPSFSDIMQIQQNSNRAANLVRQLLAFSRQQTLRPAVHDVTDILTEISHLIRRLIGANIEFDLRHGSDLGLIRVDEGQMEQVLVNLSVNARDAMAAADSVEGGGKLTIQTSMFENAEPLQRGGDKMPSGEWVLIEVADTGSGISKENLNRIFEPFFTTKDVGKGTGLGLATVHGIVRQTGGYLHVESELGKGTTFFVYLPCISAEEAAQEEAEQTQEEEVARDLTGTARILLVEDEDSVRTFSSRALVNKGYEVLTADCGTAALDVIEQQKNKEIDLLITDVIMPNMDGPTLAKHMRETSPKLKIIFISGYTEEKLKDYMGDNIWFLPKPFSLKELASKVKTVLVE